jgi:non-homologous end joining protein Ku
MHFHQVHAADREQFKQRRVCAKGGRKVPNKGIVKGYERSNWRDRHLTSACLLVPSARQLTANRFLKRGHAEVITEVLDGVKDDGCAGLAEFLL